MIKAVIFDLGGTVLKLNSKYIYRDIAKAFNLNYDFAVKKIYEISPDLNKGKIGEEVFWRRFSKKVKKELPKDYRELWIRKFIEKSRLDRSMIKIVNQLKKAGYKVALLSNIIKPHMNYEKIRGEFKYFSPVILSCEVGLWKPETKIYKLTLKKLRLKAEECVFVDNREIHLEPAKKLGMKTILFKNSKQLKKDLRKFGLKF
jgi:epoxide hydrolase-like predicted phosphatase